MKKTNNTLMKGAAIALATLMAAGSASAQNGMGGGRDGMHQIDAHTLGQWHVSFGVGATALQIAGLSLAVVSCTPKKARLFP